MTPYLEYLVLLGAAVQLVGIYSYVKDTLRGETKPNRMSWLMWSIAPLIATAAAMSDGVTWAVVPVFISGFCPLLVLIASFVNKNSYWKLESFDYICGILSLLALVLWGITKIADIAILFSIASDGLAALPTLIKSWKYPETESAAPFTAGIFNSLTSFAAIRMWTFSSYGFPVYLVLINTSIALAIYRKKFSLKK
ncbi:MAG TPA: hypothetical protein VMU27_00165 [Candidatus Paceibacterota bacterium]|nr:hypothetical protein [Candidatus Paceibacterota bacterium]